MISLHRFMSLPLDVQVDEMSKYAVSLDLFQRSKGADIALFAMHDFYVELYVERISDEIIKVSAFDSMKKLENYLDQVNIDEISSLISSE